MKYKCININKDWDWSDQFTVGKNYEAHCIHQVSSVGNSLYRITCDDNNKTQTISEYILLKLFESLKDRRDRLINNLIKKK